MQPLTTGGAALPRATMPRLEELSHPLLGDAPTLQLMPDRTDIAGKSFDATVGNQARLPLPKAALKTGLLHHRSLLGKTLSVL